MNRSKKSALSYGFYLLAKRDYGRKEIEKKLLEKYEKEEADKAVEFLLEKNFLDDERFVKNFVRLRSSYKSKQYIKNKLKLIQIENELIEKALADYYPADSEYQLAKDLAEKYLKKKEGAENLYQKTGNFLLRRGFSYDTVKQILNSVIK